MEKIEKIYQYTNLDSLAMILKNKKIRFRNLCLLDDPLEKYVKILDYDKRDHHLRYVRKNFGRFCFVSCWTHESEESIAMWDMYGDRKQGVRIALPTEMFDKSFDINKKEEKIKPLFDSGNEPVHPEFFKVDYSRLDDPKIVTKDWRIEIGNLGKYKIKEWEFQKECRFRLYAYKERNNSIHWFIPQKEEQLKDMVLKTPFSKDYFDFPLNSYAIDSIEILSGPSMPESKKVLLNALLKYYDVSSDKLHSSKLYVPEEKSK